MQRTGTRGAVWLLMTVLAAPGAGVDGVIEINQVRALAGGITPGDQPGFPVSITQGGSYRLTSDLVSSSIIEHVVEVSADGVTLDLNGFSVVGPNSCSGTPPQLVCALGGAQLYINGINAPVQGLTVKHGTVRGAVGVNVWCGPGCRVLDVTVSEGSHGIIAAGALVRGCTAMRNGFDGISTGWIGQGSSLVGNASRENNRFGFLLSGNDSAEGNVATRNGGTGFFAAGSALLTGNLSNLNGGDGFSTSGGGLLMSNTAIGNAGNGLWISQTVGFGGNVFVGNAEPQVVDNASSAQLAPNLCGASTSCL